MRASRSPRTRRAAIAAAALPAQLPLLEIFGGRVARCVWHLAWCFPSASLLLTPFPHEQVNGHLPVCVCAVSGAAQLSAHVHVACERLGM